MSIGNLTDDDDDDDDGIGAGGGGGKDDTILDEEGNVSLGDQYEDDGLDQLKFDPSYCSHSWVGIPMETRVLRMEFGGLGNYDHGTGVCCQYNVATLSLRHIRHKIRCSRFLLWHVVRSESSSF